MKRYEIKIWKWQELLHKGSYDFEDAKQATAFELGLYEGFRIANKNPTGSSTKEVHIDCPLCDCSLTGFIEDSEEIRECESCGVEWEQSTGVITSNP